MKTGNYIYVDGLVTELLPNTMFRIESGVDGRKILATMKGSMRKAYVRIFPGDKVRVEMAPYDKERGRIIAKL